MLSAEFDFALPPELIALRPAEPRGASRLLVVRPCGSLEHRMFGELPDLLRSRDILCLNDSRVISGRLEGRRQARQAGGEDVKVDITLHRRVGLNRFRAFVQPAKRLRPGDDLQLADGFSAQVTNRNEGEVELAFNRSGDELDRAIAAAGRMPLPPYIAKQRPPDGRDDVDYQTVYAAHNGSVAAPTAGLHFTIPVLNRLVAAGIEIAPVTLHVGAGTFLPVTTDDINGHRIHSEKAHVSAETARRLNHAHAAGGRVVAVGTTTLRTLESAASEVGRIEVYDGDTDIFIMPGYRFRAVDVLLTNFHLPCSTLFILVAAFMGLDVMRAAYAEAIRQRYRFYSYGDACLLFRPL